MRKILVANRGEIALRIMKTIRKMGLESIAVYSEADRNSPHVRYADEAIHIGPSPSHLSYLNMDMMIQKARENNIDAIHPGYGFLSENSVFAKRVTESGIIFIGPTPSAIDIMGNKLSAKEAVKSYNIPMVPGLATSIDSTDETSIKNALNSVSTIGFPLLIKAAAGGGGKGMRIVENEKEFTEQLDRAVSEATASFGNGDVFLEKYIASPRHIEIQVLADQYGNIVHLFERECSIQRRHQKVIEEAPSSVLSPELREEMGQAAINVAKSCNYVGAGTVEFLLDEDLNFYFLEMNTRLQVEHPVTEMITGLDLVEQQIRVANGETLSFSQQDLKINGHAIELRVYAEDPLNDFLPSIGELTVYRSPKGKNIRVDDGFTEGMKVPIYYDPMLSKLIVWGKTRQECINVISNALKEYHISGVKTTIPFGQFVFKNEHFINGNFNTNFVKQHFSSDLLIDHFRENHKVAALVGIHHYLEQKKKVREPTSSSKNWQNRLNQ